jgi:long-subunit acyl-CoA synthetase (AMP-forming)
MNQIIACNDFSTPAYMVPGSIGRFLGKMWISDKGELNVDSNTVFNHYVNDANHTNFVREDGHLRTRDSAIQDESGTFVVLGRMVAKLKVDDKEIQLDQIERIVRGLPYVEECVIVMVKEAWDDNNLRLLASPNQRYIESHGLSLVRADKILYKFVEEMKNKLPGCNKLVDACFSQQVFERSFDGKIKSRLYRPNLH